jgi:hypothetical protein
MDNHRGGSKTLLHLYFVVNLSCYHVHASLYLCHFLFCTAVLFVGVIVYQLMFRVFKMCRARISRKLDISQIVLSCSHVILLPIDERVWQVTHVVCLLFLNFCFYLSLFNVLGGLHCNYLMYSWSALSLVFGVLISDQSNLPTTCICSFIAYFSFSIY